MLTKYRFVLAFALTAVVSSTWVRRNKFAQIDPKIIYYENLVNKTKERVLESFQESERKGIRASMELSSGVQRLTSRVFDAERLLHMELRAGKKELVETVQGAAVKTRAAAPCLPNLDPEAALKKLEQSALRSKKCLRKLKESCESLEVELTKTIIEFRAYAMVARVAVGKCQRARDKPPDGRCLEEILEEVKEAMEVLPYRIIGIKHRAKPLLESAEQTIALCLETFRKEKGAVGSEVRQCQQKGKT